MILIEKTDFVNGLKSCRTVKLSLTARKKRSNIWRRELLKNKIYSLLLIGVGALSTLIEYDGTFFIFTLMLGIPIFFSKKNWIT